MTRTYNLGHRIVCLVLCLVCLLTAVMPAAADGTDAAEYTYTSLVHYRAYTSSSVIGQMEDGTQLTILEESGDFYKIDCYDITGYIAKSQVQSRENGEYYVSCDPNSGETQTMEYVGMSDALLLRSSILALTQKQLGYPYVYGGSNPGGFDCSGLTTYIYKMHEYALHRCADEQLQDGLIVAKEGMQVGDLVFFRESGSSALASHVGIYVGDNQIIHAGSKGISYADLDGEWYTKYFLCARRIVNTSTAGIELMPTVTIERAAVSRSSGIRTAS